MKRILLIGLVLGLLISGGVVYAAVQNPQWVAGQKLVGVYGVSNGDVLIITTQYNQIVFTYQYADTSKDNLTDYLTYPFDASFDQVSASVCGNVAHVVTHSSIGNSLYSVSWTLPISDTHITYLPIIVCGASWPNN